MAIDLETIKKATAEPDKWRRGADLAMSEGMLEELERTFETVIIETLSKNNQISLLASINSESMARTNRGILVERNGAQKAALQAMVKFGFEEDKYDEKPFGDKGKSLIRIYPSSIHSDLYFQRVIEYNDEKDPVSLTWSVVHKSSKAS